MKTYDTDESGPVRNRVDVGVSERFVASEGQTLVAYGVGSCVTVVVRDDASDVGGMATAVLPTQEAGQGGATGRYADAATEALVREAAAAGAGYADMEAVLVGGATIIEFDDLTAGVGPANVEAAREKLAALGVPVTAEATGGDVGRTVRFETGRGRLLVETVDGDREAL